MKTVKNIFLYILLVAMAACSADQDIIETDNSSTNPEGQPITFRIGFGSLTKVTTDEKFRSQFEEGDEIGVFMVTSGQALKSSDNYADNVKLTYTNGEWAQEGELFYYPVDGSSLDFYAYYPYAENIDPLNFNFEVMQNQQDNQAYSKSDLLYAKVENLRNKDVPLLFSHLLSLIQVEVVREGDLVAFDNTFVVSFLSQSNSASVNLTNGTAVKQTASPTEITMNRVEEEGNTKNYTYRALVPAYTIPQEEVIFTFVETTPGKAMDFKYSVEAETELTPNKVSKWKITLEGDPIPPHYYALGDLYPHDGEPEGIVFEISNDGLNGKVVYLWEKTGRWGDTSTEEANSLPSMKDQENGKQATQDLIALRRDKGNFKDGGDYTLFYWLYTEVNNSDLQGKWYFPAKEELKSFYAYMNGIDYEEVKNTWKDGDPISTNMEATLYKREAFKQRIEDELGGSELNIYGQYWTSTEITQSTVYSIHFNTGILQTGKKKDEEMGRVRPICEF